MNLQEVTSNTLELGDFNVNGSPEAGVSDVFSGGDAAGNYEFDGDTWTQSGAGGDGDEISVADLQTAISNAGAYSGGGTTIEISEEGVVTNTASGDAVYVEGDTLTATPETPVTSNPLEALDDALSQVDSQRSELGALQNRFDSAITNLTSARSRIEDADYATEVADMTRNQILQQAGTSVLAQANQLPQNALSLLG